MKQSPAILNALRAAGLMAIIIVGLVSIIGTDGGSGGGYSSDADGLYYHRDADGDGYGDPYDTTRSTTLPQGYVTDRNDCNDTDPTINPGAAEVCEDTIDNNCDGYINEGCACNDNDGDGYYGQNGCGTATDCDDTDPAVNPGVGEICGDGLDNNCDGLIDNICDNCTDTDGDSYFVQSGCGRPVDCDDTDADIHPGAPDICGNNTDDDCDGQADENCPLLPDTGQTDCYNNYIMIDACPAEGLAFSGQDAFYTINPPFFTKLDVGGSELHQGAAVWTMVRDNVTGLVWEAKTDDGSIHDRDNRYTWYTINDAFIARLNADQFGGYADWRMPTLKELLYLADYGTYTPSIDTDYFPNTAKGPYLSFADPTVTSGGSCRLDFLSGRSYVTSQPGSYYVRAVRGPQSSPLLTLNNSSTVTDSTTGLMWARSAAATAMTWKEALAWCDDLTLAGYDDWRLPTIKELASIVEIGGASPAVDTSYFPDTLLAYYWSSTTNDYYPDDAWLINFSNGENAYGNKLKDYHVRAVRGGR